MNKPKETRSRPSLYLALAVLCLLTFPQVSHAVVISNGIAEDTVGHFRVDVLTGGESRDGFVTAQRFSDQAIVTPDVLFDYFSFVDLEPETEGGVVRLSGSDPVLNPETNMVSSSGSFVLPNENTILWTATSRIEAGSRVMTTRFTFADADGEPLGPLRFLQYLDEDVEAVADDVFLDVGSANDGTLELFTVDNTDLYGLSQSGAFILGSGLENAMFAGWAAGQFSAMRDRITDGLQLVSFDGFIDDGLPPLTHEQLGPVFGPRDITSVLAWDVDPNSSTAAITTSLGGVAESEILPTLPTASNVSISGTPQVGQVLTGSYTYFDADGDVEGASTFRWLREVLDEEPVPIVGATAPTYTLEAADEGALIRFEVTPVAQTGPSPGVAVTSEPVGPVAPPINLPPTASNVLITGTPQVGQLLTGSYDYADAEGNLEGASTFRWLRNGAPIEGATAQTYILAAADEATMVSFEVTPVAQTGTSPGIAVVSAAVGPVTAAVAVDFPPVASAVRIPGTPQVGQVLMGDYTYSDTEGDLEGASTFRWLRSPALDDEIVSPIDGATDRNYTLVAADEGALIRFEVTPVAQSGPSPGLAATSAPVGPITPAPNDPPTASSVLISGIAQVARC